MQYLVRYLLLALLFVLIARSFWRFIGSILEGASGQRRSRQGPPGRGVAMERDPVCGTFVVPSDALVVSDKGRALYFCSARCRDAYQAHAAPRAREAR